MPKFFVRKTATKTHHSDHDEEDPLKTMLSWTAPSRPFRKKDRSYYTTIAVIAILVMLIALLAREFILMAAVMAFCFVAYVLGFTPPEDVEYKITGQGITIGDHFYFWGDLDSFWFSQKEGQKVLHILTHYKFPGQIILLLGPQDEENVKKLVAKYLLYHEIPPKSVIDNWADSLQKHFPLENPHR